MFKKGFGDIVPGQNTDDKMQAPKLVFTVVYLLIGLAFLSMAFDLMQEEIVSKCKWIGIKIGIIEKDIVVVKIKTSEQKEKKMYLIHRYHEKPVEKVGIQKRFIKNSNSSMNQSNYLKNQTEI